VLIASGSPYQQPTERQRVGNQIKAAFILARFKRSLKPVGMIGRFTTVVMKRAGLDFTD
jgi:hypothetical protein